MANEYWLLSNLSLSEGTNLLTWNPYPSEFQAYSETKVDGTGVGIGLGFFQFKWVAPFLTATQWDYLMSMFSGWEPSADVYVRTRTDATLASASGTEGGYMFLYRWFSCKMWRPAGEPCPIFRYKNVEIVFTHGEII